MSDEEPGEVQQPSAAAWMARCRECDVSRKYPSEVDAQAAAWWHDYRHHRDEWVTEHGDIPVSLPEPARPL